MWLFDVFRIGKIKAENKKLQQDLVTVNKRLQDLHADEYYQIKERLVAMNSEVQDCNTIISKLRDEISSLSDHNQKLDKQVRSQQNKLSRCKELYKSMEYSLDNFFQFDIPYEQCKLSKAEFDEVELISPSIYLKLHCMDMKDLRKAYRENEKQITSLLNQYSARYTTKANKSIYNLMVIALRAELQNILYNLKYEKLDQSIEHVKTISAKYLKIAGEGNQSIAGTLTKFIGEIEYLFINATKIEYNYYVKKEQAKQEQMAIREQMRQEAEERKALETERKRVEKEEAKYNNEIQKITEVLSSAVDNVEIQALKNRILELQGKLSDVALKKEEITNLQNGKAGNVYIISNLGSFGENVFKVGMTRRLNPQDRVNELGDASVPFRFDVHSFIFSEDAVELENKLHQMLNDKRVNKVNMRKEFFHTSVDELEELVSSIDPTAEFNRTMLAEEYRQSLSSDEVYSSSMVLDSYYDEE